MDVRDDGRLILRIEEHEVGKKYDAWQDAREASKQAEGRLSDVRGGSTQQAYEEATTNRQQASINEADTYNQFINDPEG